jgi:hypothetical protein
MNMKLQILQCLMTALLSTSTIMPSTIETPAITTSEYLPITSYQQSLSEMISNYIRSLLYEKDQTNTTTNPQERYIPELSREEALEAIKLITTKIFDIHDTDYVSKHLLTMKKLSQSLHPEDDIRTIDAIHFLLANQHRSSTLDQLFWWNANKKHEFDTTIPVTEETKAKTDKLAVIFKKMGLEAKNKKEKMKANVEKLTSIL